jgi:16S rRNA (cytidine1402-2'-O)-methyltransferase
MSRLILLPNLLSPDLPWEPFLPASVANAVKSLNGLIAESEKEGRRFLRRFVSHETLERMPIRLLNEHTNPSELDSLLDPVAGGQIWGLISDAGLPCLADPGALLVKRAIARSLAVQTLAGPSSIIFALQLSGLNGQRFSFHGYLPRDIVELKVRLLALERRSKEEDATQIWIEAPYRSQKMADIVIQALHPETLFCIAHSITQPNESVRVQPIKDWRKEPLHLEKVPAVFLLHS